MDVLFDISLIFAQHQWEQWICAVYCIDEKCFSPFHFFFLKTSVYFSSDNFQAFCHLLCLYSSLYHLLPFFFLSWTFTLLALQLQPEASFSPTWVEEGSSLTLQCTFTSALLPPQHDITWFRDGKYCKRVKESGSLDTGYRLFFHCSRRTASSVQQCGHKHGR